MDSRSKGNVGGLTSNELKWKDLIDSKERSSKRKELALQIQNLRQRVDRLNDKMDAFLACVRSRASKSPSPSPTPNRTDSP